MFNYQGKWALITGASAGIGTAFAHALAQRGSHLILVARRADRLNALAQSLRAQYQVDVDTIALDLAPVNAAQQLFDQVQTRGRRIDLLINNAGIGVFGPFLTTKVEEDEKLVMLNVVALTMLTRLFLPQLLQQPEGMIINVASTAAFQPLPYMAIYGASKAYVLSFTEALWAEHRQDKLHVLALCPGPVTTEFFSAMGNEMHSFGKRDTADDIVKQTLAIADKNRMYFIPGMLKNYWQAQLTRLLPRKLLASVTGNVLRKNLGQH